MSKRKNKNKYPSAGHAESRIERLYLKLLKAQVEPLFKRPRFTTYTQDLEKAGHQLLGSYFHGVCASDKIPTSLSKTKPYAIVNLDKSDEAGSHWIAVAHHPKEKKLYVYDSYGRPTQKMSPFLLKSIKKKYPHTKLIDADTSDAEQTKKEKNCGQRSLAWLFLFHCWGAELAVLI